ncbi:tyrosine--tRNA ligase [Candidatus Woesearchaeota archaeon]|nr:tyrosine--tRNA ligase [Candidatus Woesearchaeota archaeon]
MDIGIKLELIKRNTEEIITEKELIDLLTKKKKPSVYLGTAVTGQPHIAYFIWVLKLSDFLRAGFKVKLLLADLHGALDNTPWDKLDKRFKYYKEVIPLMFKSINTDIKNFEIVKGSDFQLSSKYFFDVLRMSTFTTINDTTRAASEVVKMGDNPKLSGLIYPIMQSLDEEYLGIDVQYGGVDQRKILVFARENLPKLSYKPRIEIMTPMIPGLMGKKMSASDPSSKIDLLDNESTVVSKLKKAHCEAGIVENNGLLAFLKHVIIPIKIDNKEKFVIERDQKYGGNIVYNNYEEIENDFINKKLHPQDLKSSLAKEINNLLKTFNKNRTSLEKLRKEAYS